MIDTCDGTRKARYYRAAETGHGLARDLDLLVEFANRLHNLPERCRDLVNQFEDCAYFKT